MQVPQLLHFLPFVETRKIWPHTKPIGICQKDVGLSGSQVCFANWLRGLTLSWGKKRRKTGNWIGCSILEGGSAPKPRRPSPEPSEPSPEPRWTWPGACTSAHRSYCGLKTPLAYAVGEKVCWGGHKRVVAGLGTSYNLIEYCSHFVYIFWFSNSVCESRGICVPK